MQAVLETVAVPVPCNMSVVQFALEPVLAPEMRQ